MSRWTDARNSVTGAVGGFLGGGGLSSVLPTGGLPMPPGLPGLQGLPGIPGMGMGGGGGQQQAGGGGSLGGTMQTSGDPGELGYPQNLAGLMQLIGSNQQPQNMNLIGGGGLI